MSKTLFICAMEKEGRQIARKLEMKQIDSDLFENENERLLISGIGKQLTAINLTKYLCNNEKPRLIINIGYAGSTDLKIGTWVNISKVYNYEWYIPGEEKFVMLAGGSQNLELLKDEKLDAVECYSSESFVTNTDLEGHIAFDMELHSISLICDLYKIQLLSLKKISDSLSLDDYYDNLKNENIFELESCVDFFRKK